MKLIDKQGRLLGRWNIVDTLVVLFLLCLTPMIYFGYKLYHFQDANIQHQKNCLRNKLDECEQLKGDCEQLKEDVVKFIERYRRARRHFPHLKDNGED